MRTVTNLFIFNLCVADLINTIFNSTFNYVFMKNKWVDFHSLSHLKKICFQRLGVWRILLSSDKLHDTHEYRGRGVDDGSHCSGALHDHRQAQVPAPLLQRDHEHAGHYLDRVHNSRHTHAALLHHRPLQRGQKQDGVSDGVAWWWPERVLVWSLLSDHLLPGHLHPAHGGSLHHLLSPRHRALEENKLWRQSRTLQQTKQNQGQEKGFKSH